ncbi:hypothetical protein KWG64_06375 [Rahnella sp. PD12R]|uniref:hypothetical protein n=1 Tax=Rahnella sp. PD12R TaxID=2855688 RepID=UPI001C481A8E|nr:hypothetical protein [Rahnella sp. PD12R]MBV6817566.1 hypothetical protein [Rahnella sp. PD12R]
MECDFILFGYGHEGSLRSTDYHGGDVVNFMPAVVVQGFRPGEVNAVRGQPLMLVSFNVVRHTSGIDGRTYFLAVADGETPENIDIRILGENPNPAP